MFARRIKSDNFVSFVSASFIAQGRLQAIWLFQMLGGKGNVVILGGRAGAGSTEQRKRAYYEVAQWYPDIKILDFQYTGYSPAKAKKIMAAWIQSYGKDKIHGVLNGGLQGAGALEAMNEAGMKVPITGEPCNGVLKRVQQWGFPGMVASSPPALAGDCVDVGLKVLQGVNVPFLNETKRYISCTADTADIKSDVPWDKITRMDKDDNWWDNFVDPKFLPKD
jgi:ribose transport system substrate-binding protein